MMEPHERLARNLTWLLAVGYLVLANIALRGEDSRIWALEQIEGSGDTAEVGDGGAAVGVLQIHRIMVDEANRVLGERRFDYADRLSPERSREIALVVLRDAKTAEEVAAVWNPGAGEDYVARLGNLMRWHQENAE